MRSFSTFIYIFTAYNENKTQHSETWRLCTHCSAYKFFTP